MCSGVIHGKDIIALQGTNTNGAIKRIQYVIIDYTDVEESYVSPEEVKLIVKNDLAMLSINPDMFIVTVVPNEIFRVMSSLYAAYAEEYLSQIKLFETRDEATNWIKDNI